MRRDTLETSLEAGVRESRSTNAYWTLVNAVLGRQQFMHQPASDHMVAALLLHRLPRVLGQDILDP